MATAESSRTPAGGPARPSVPNKKEKYRPLIALTVTLSGCACLPSAGLTALGIAGTVVNHDPLLLVTAGPECVRCLIAQAEIRIDRFDKHGKREGYIIIDPKTGRADEFDKNSNRTGYGTTTTPKLTDEQMRKLDTERRSR